MPDLFENAGPPLETGITATATAPLVAAASPFPAATAAPVSPSPPAMARAPAVQMPDGWTLHRVAALVTDVAQNMYDLPYLLKKHGLTQAQYETLQANPFFQRALEAEVITWAGANSIQKRLMLESAIAVESALPTVAARLSGKGEPLGEVVALLKVLAEMAGTIGAKAVNSTISGGERIKIVINLGEDSLRQDVAVAATPLIDMTAVSTDG